METALESILEVALQQGIWAALYGGLFTDLQHDVRARDVYRQSD